MTRFLPLFGSVMGLLVLGCFDAGADEDGSEGSTVGETVGDGDGDTVGDGDGDTVGDGDGDGDTGPMCDPGETACGGACVILDEDPAHCGACDHDCLGGSCTAGTCEPVLLASGKGRLFMVHVDQTNVYYGGDGVDVGRIGKDANNDTVLVPAGADIQDREWCYDSAFTGDAIVWGNDWVQPGVRGCDLPDCMGGVQTYFSGMNLLAMGFDPSTNTLYWGQGQNLVEATWPGGTMTTFAAGDGSPREIVSDGDFIYWVERIAADNYSVRKQSIGGGNITELAINRPSITGLAVGPSKVYWGDDAAIVEAPLPNGVGAAEPPVFAPVTDLRRMVSDDTHLYWTSQQVGVNTVGRCPLEGCDGPPQILAQVMQPWGITLDAVAAYFVTEDGEIYKVAK